MLPEKFVYVSVAFNIWSTAHYLIATLKGSARPNRVSWLMWALAALIAAAAQWSEGVGLSTWFVFTAGFGPLLIFLASFVGKAAYWQTTSFDLLCGVFSALGVIGWLLSREGDVAILFSIVGDFCAALPTLRKAYAHPESENGPAFILGFVSAAVALLSVQQHTLASYGFTAYITFMCALLIAIRYRHYFGFAAPK